jgi:hypothetical protein
LAGGLRNVLPLGDRDEDTKLLQSHGGYSIKFIGRKEYRAASCFARPAPIHRNFRLEEHKQ